MPLYEYQCEACGKRFEAIQKFSDAPLETCRLCEKGPVRKLMSSPAFQLKGTGWYVTDFANKGKTGAAASSAKGDESSSSDSAAKTDTAAKSDASSSSSTTKEAAKP